METLCTDCQDTMNWNTARCHRVLLPAVNVEFEESERKLKETVSEGVYSLNTNLSAFFHDSQGVVGGHGRQNPSKPQLNWTQFLET